MEVLWENAKEVRDFYRGGVQQKAKAEKKYQEKQYPEALKLYDNSNEFLMVVWNYIKQDSAEYTLFEGTDILFFPNLLIADNYLKAGLALKQMGKESPARRKWKQALSYVQRSLQWERTEWALSVQREIESLLSPPNR
jgi:tetratricopeptide (TPR) repeat protein